MANPNVNRIDTVIAAVDETKINDDLSNAITVFTPYAHPLTPEERISFFGLKEENFIFAKDALAQGLILFAGLPPAMQQLVTNLQKDIEMYSQVKSIREGLLAQLDLSLSDTGRLAAHESYAEGLGLYKYIEAGAQLGLPGFQAAFDALKDRFASQGGGGSIPNPVP